MSARHEIASSVVVWPSRLLFIERRRRVSELGLPFDG